MHSRFQSLVPILAGFLAIVTCWSPAAGQERARSPVGVEELQDDQFERLLRVLAGEIRAALDQAQIQDDCVCRMPRVTFRWTSNAAAEARFCSQFVAGLQPLLQGRVRFVDREGSSIRLSCLIEFSNGAAEQATRQLRFALRDDRVNREILALDFDYPPRTAESAAPRAPAPPRGAEPILSDEVPVIMESARGEGGRSAPRKFSHEKRIKLDLAPRDLADRVVDGLMAYEDQTVFWPTGRVILLDADDARRFWITSVQAERREDDRLRIQVAMRARGERRKAKLRMVYLDGTGRPLAVSLIHEYRCPQSETVTAVFEAADPRAAGYVCLFEGD